ncbi:MAG TPA: dTMP kinase [Nitrososphaeraceae archaeon]|jgi:dTMP kinase|nr:dTMP kinase [Nitrososphaeraceae archaeon]
MMSDTNHKINYYGHGIPYYENIEIKGKLLIIEGPDSSGRSTQISLLNSHLEANGHAVVNTGLRRSELISEGIVWAKEHHLLRKRTMSLFYAADFADQLENKIIPALRAGYIVLADRYIYTLMARDAVRKINRRWSHNLYGFAIKPNLVFYLDVEPKELLRRVFEKNMTLDYYESGEDLGLSDDVLESFLLYQQKIKQEFIRMQKSYGIIPINGNRSIESVNSDLQKKIDVFLDQNRY